jgi:hypothetical protein
VRGVPKDGRREMHPVPARNSASHQGRAGATIAESSAIHRAGLPIRISSREISPPCSAPITSIFVGLIFTMFSLQSVFIFNRPEIFSLLSTSNGMH